MMRFRLRTLLIVTAWTGLLLIALREPTPFWSAAIALITLLSVLFAILLVIYCHDDARTGGVGYVIFCVGYLLYVGIATQWFSSPLSSGLSDDRSPGLLFNLIHPANRVPLDVGGEMILPPPYEARFFLSVCNHAIACVLGFLGAVTAKLLHSSATER